MEAEVKGVEKSITSFKDLKIAIKLAKDEQIAMAEKFGATSAEAVKAGKKLADLKDKVEDLNDATKSLKGSGVEKLNASFSLLGEGIGTFNGDKIKTAFKGIGSAMSAIPIFLIIQGLKYLYDNFDKIKKVVENVIPGFKAVSKFIGGIVNSITDFIGITSDATRAVDALRQSADKQLAVNKKYLQEHGDQVNKYTAQKIDAKNRYLEAIKEDGANVAALGQRLNRELANIDKQRLDDTKKTNEDKVKKTKEDNDKALQLQLDKAKKAKEAKDKKLQLQLELQAKLKELQTELIVGEQEKEQKILKNKFLADQKDLYNKGANAELLKALNDNFEKDKLDISNKFKKIKEDKDKEDDKKELQIKLSNLESGYQLELQKLGNNDAEKLILQKKHLKEIYDINIANAKLLELNTTDLTNKYLLEKEALEKAARDKKTEADKKAEADEKARKTQLQKDIVDSVNIAAQTALSVQKTLSDTYYMKETQKVNKLYRDKLKNVVQGSKEEKAILDQKAKDEKDLARQQFETQKKFNRASAILNGILGIGAILAVPDPTLGILSAIRIGALAISTAANIASINATQFDEGGASAGAIPAAETSAPTTSQAPAIYGPGQGQSTTFTGNQNNNFAPVKAYVVETENRSTTNRVNKLVSESTYG